MKTNLDVLKDEIQTQLSEDGIAVFCGFRRSMHRRSSAYWDTSSNADFRPFLEIARRAGVKVVVFNHLEFTRDMLDEAHECLQELDLPPDERRGFERKLKNLLAYQGFTCTLQASYDIEGCTYVYELKAEWYSEYLAIVDELDMYDPGDEGDEDEDSMGDFFSRN